MIAPIIGDLRQVSKPAGIPGPVRAGGGRLGDLVLRVLALAESGLTDVPCQPQDDGFRLSGGQRKGHE